MANYDRNTKNESDPSKPKDLTKPSTAEASSAEPKVKTDEKNGPDLAALNANGPGTDEARTEAAKQAGVQTPDSDTEGDFEVAEGHSVTSQRGILGPGTTVSARDFSGGDERLNELAKSGTLVRKSERREAETKLEPTNKT